MFAFVKNLFADDKQSRRSAVSSCRKLHLESLESRELLSVSPLYHNADVPVTPYALSTSAAADAPAYISDTNLTTLDNSDQITFYARFTAAADLSGSQYLLAHDCTSNQGDELYLRITDGVLQFGTWDSINDFGYEYASLSITAGQEYSVFGVFNNGTMDLYANNMTTHSEHVSSIWSENIKDFTTLSPKWYVGRNGENAAPQAFNGEILEVAIYNTALEGTEIDELFQKDDWKISMSVTDNVAIERIASVEQDYGTFRVKRKLASAVGGDTSYAVTATISVGNGGIGITESGSESRASTDDYILQYQNAANEWITLSHTSSSMVPAVVYYAVTIPVNRTYVNLRVVPLFDWEDEGDLFDPFQTTDAGTPKSDKGEFVCMGITSAGWSNMSTDWETLDSISYSKIEIKDGSFLSVTSDVDNNGTINQADYAARHGSVGSLLLKDTQEYAAYYVWIDELGSQELALTFAGTGGVEYVCSFNNDSTGYVPSAPEVLSGSKNLAQGTVTINGAGNSANTASGSLSLSVGGGNDWTRFSVFSVTVDMAFNYDRNDNFNDGLNIRTSGAANTEHYDAELKQSGGDVIYNTPNGSANNGKVLYLKETLPVVYCRFETTLKDLASLTLDIDATSGFSIGGLTSSEITFVNGISENNGIVPGTTSGTASSILSGTLLGVSGFSVFLANSNTGSAAAKETDTFTWDVSHIGNKMTGTGTATTTGEITIYTVLDAPSGAWNVADTLPASSTSPAQQDNKQQPWVSALDFAIETAGTNGETTPESALSQLTNYLHTDHGMTYDTEKGASKYTASNNSPFDTFLTASYMAKSKGNVVNCYDQAAAVTVFGRLLGINVNFAFSQPFGYINTTVLVGGITTNNPFFDKGDTYSPRAIVDITNPAAYAYNRIVDIDAEGANYGNRTSFGNHAFAMLGDDVYDACAGPITGMPLLSYLEHAIDFDANVQHSLMYGWIFAGVAADVTYTTYAITLSL